MKFTVCPFCGLVVDGAHDSQQACIDALRAEITRTREVLIRVGDSGHPEAPDLPESPAEDEDPSQS